LRDGIVVIVYRYGLQGKDVNLKNREAQYGIEAIVDEPRGHSLLPKRNRGLILLIGEKQCSPKFVTNWVIRWMQRLPDECDINEYTAPWNTSSPGS
jgi:hypothetical protein